MSKVDERHAAQQFTVTAPSGKETQLQGWAALCAYTGMKQSSLRTLFSIHHNAVPRPNGETITRHPPPIVEPPPKRPVGRPRKDGPLMRGPDPVDWAKHRKPKFTGRD